MSPRFRLVARFCAVCLVVLIAMPFTAPFRTWDLTALADGVQGHESSGGDNVAKDAAPAALTVFGVPMSLATIVRPSGSSSITSGHQPFVTVLRL